MLESARLQAIQSLDGSATDSKKAYAVVPPDHAKDARHLRGFIGGSCVTHWHILLDYHYRVERQHSDRFLSCFVEGMAQVICERDWRNPLVTWEELELVLEWVNDRWSWSYSEAFVTCGGQYYKPQGVRR